MLAAWLLLAAPVHFASAPPTPPAPAVAVVPASPVPAPSNPMRTGGPTPPNPTRTTAPAPTTTTTAPAPAPTTTTTTTEAASVTVTGWECVVTAITSYGDVTFAAGPAGPAPIYSCAAYVSQYPTPAYALTPEPFTYTEGAGSGG